ncbi:MAG TPA: hypothetical protein DEF45_19530 [Rhodopirellula sp.]|nr:hypothetical protein [Rhodopirellula sp.]
MLRLVKQVWRDQTTQYRHNLIIVFLLKQFTGLLAFVVVPDVTSTKLFVPFGSALIFDPCSSGPFAGRSRWPVSLAGPVTKSAQKWSKSERIACKRPIPDSRGVESRPLWLSTPSDFSYAE